MESLAPFPQGSCIPCSLPVYPGAPHNGANHPIHYWQTMESDRHLTIRLTSDHDTLSGASIGRRVLGSSSFLVEIRTNGRGPVNTGTAMQQDRLRKLVETLQRCSTNPQKFVDK